MPPRTRSCRLDLLVGRATSRPAAATPPSRSTYVSPASRTSTACSRARGTRRGLPAPQPPRRYRAPSLMRPRRDPGLQRARALPARAAHRGAARMGLGACAERDEQFRRRRPPRATQRAPRPRDQHRQLASQSQQLRAALTPYRDLIRPQVRAQGARSRLGATASCRQRAASWSRTLERRRPGPHAGDACHRQVGGGSDRPRRLQPAPAHRRDQRAARHQLHAPDHGGSTPIPCSPAPATTPAPVGAALATRHPSRARSIPRRFRSTRPATTSKGARQRGDLLGDARKQPQSLKARLGTIAPRAASE